MGNGERLTLVLAKGCGDMNVTNARQITLEQATTAPTAEQRWMEGMRMAYIVPKELPKTCFECVFCQCKFSYPFWAEMVPATEREKQGYFCSLDTHKPKRVMVVDFGDKTKKMEWCPLKETEKVVRCKDCKHYEEDFCWRWGGIRHSEHFCSYGERRDK